MNFIKSVTRVVTKQLSHSGNNGNNEIHYTLQCDTLHCDTFSKLAYLMKLIYHNDYNTLKQVIESNAYEDIFYTYEFILFYNTIISGNVKCLIVLINDAGFSPDLRDRHGNTALHYGNLNTDCAMVLLNYIDVNTRNNFGSTPLHHAIECNIECNI